MNINLWGKIMLNKKMKRLPFVLLTLLFLAACDTGSSGVPVTSLSSSAPTTLSTSMSVTLSNTTTTFIVTFKPENGSADFTQSVTQFHLIIKPTNPIKANHQFIGWYTDLDEAWVFSGYPVTQNLTLTAKYELVEIGTDGLLFTPTIYEGKQGYVFSGYEGESVNITIPSNFNSLNVIGINPWAFCFLKSNCK
jgi:uncharacterized repeat protein (TIGR02543 family)